MGICVSCEPNYESTSKLVHVDGTLQEFSYLVKVSYILQSNPSCFICNSDEMDFNGVISAMSDNDELRPGNLYFALPMIKLKQKLHPEEMAALAVKASSALTKIGSNVRACSPEPSIKVTDGENCAEKVCRRKIGCGNPRRRKFAVSLATIAE